MRKITWDYIGGFFDGEGCIYFNPKLKKGIHAFVGIYQSENQAKVLYKIKAFLTDNNIESKIYIRKEVRKGQNYKGISLEIGHRIEVLNFLKIIKFYLIVKRNQCDKVIKKIEALLQDNKSRRSTTLYERKQIKKLWSKGKKPKEISKILGLKYGTVNHFVYNKKFHYDK